MKALVINQDSQTQRMAFQTEQLQALEIDFQRMPSILVNGTSDPVYKKLYSTWQRPMTVAEVSCFLSHKHAWEVILSSNEPMLILEDDAWLADDIKSVLDELNKTTEIDYATLELVRRNRKKLIAKQSTHTFASANLYRLYQGRSGAAGYVLWPSGAKKLLDKAAKGHVGIADKFINACLSLEAYQVEPALIIQLEQCAFHGITPPLEVSSSITTKTNVNPKLVDKVRYKIRRIIGEAKVGLNLCLHIHHADRRHIKLSDNFKHRSQS